MKKNILNSMLCCLAVLMLYSSCKKNDIPKETVEANVVNSDVSRPEGYYPSYTGKTIRAIYDGRDVQLLEIENGKYLYDGDIVLERKDFKIVSEPGTEGVIVTVQKGRLWFARRVNYSFAASVGAAYKKSIAQALTAWTTQVGFSFTYRASGDYVEFQQNNVGKAYSTGVGQQGGRQIISIDPNHYNAGTIIHEIGHALGMHHEQSRPDRDKYITVNYKNIQSAWTSQYDKCWYCIEHGKFDFGSIMLYGSYGGTAAIDRNKPIMTRKNGTTFIGQRSALSAGDKAAINSRYP